MSRPVWYYKVYWPYKRGYLLRSRLSEDRLIDLIDQFVGDSSYQVVQPQEFPLFSSVTRTELVSALPSDAYPVPPPLSDLDMNALVHPADLGGWRMKRWTDMPQRRPPGVPSY